MAGADEIVKIVISKESDRKFTVSRQIAEMSQTIRNLLEALPDLDEEIPLSNLSADDFQKNDPVMTEEERKEWKNKELEGFDAEFTKIDNDLAPLYNLTLAANYLDIRPMLDVCCKALAQFIKSKTPDQIKEFMGITDEFTDEEVAEAKAEHAWLKDVTLPKKKAEAAA